MKGSCIAFRTRGGSSVFLEENHTLPLVDLQLTLRTGSVYDPKGLEGLTRITASMIRMGTKRLCATAVQEAIDRLGAQLYVLCAPSYVHFTASVVERNLKPFLSLLDELVCRPAWRPADLDFVKRQTIADIVEIRDNDQMLAVRHFRRFALAGHPYGRSVLGTIASVKAIRRKDVIRLYGEHYLARNLIIGAAGAVSEALLRELLDSSFNRLSGAKPPTEKVVAPRFATGRRVLVVDKPARSQTQILIGALGTSARDADYFPLLVGNTIFGGTFTARLMREIRSKRGWSYGASSRLAFDRQRDLWSMWAFPAAQDALACTELQLALLEKLIDQGITRNELAFAKDYLIKSHAFEIDTAAKRLGLAMETELFRLASDFHSRFVEKIRAVTRDQVNQALKKRLSKRNLAIVIVATYEDIRKQLESFSGVTSISVVPFDEI
ncbi:MAG: insulinase family protein [Deltaproteobacteria bacterium]|nr:insulinase family protein [Deltaproteobacteria bacterium]